MQDTNIEWADLTWNATRGCSRISPGCVHCYAEQIAARYSGERQPFAGFAEFRIIGGKREAHWTGRVELIEDKLREPLSKERWAKKFADKHGRKPRCFVNSMSDLFHENLPFDDIDRVMSVMALAEWINFLVLTKRQERLYEYFGPSDELDGLTRDVLVEGGTQRLYERRTGEDPSMWLAVNWPLPNVWLGCSVEDRVRKERIDYLRNTPAAVRFLSLEPLLEDLGEIDLTGISWVIVGGESGHGARPFNIDWARSIIGQCKNAGVAAFVKQLGAKPEGPCGAVKNMPLEFNDRKGGDMSEWPEDLRVREFPEVRA